MSVDALVHKNHVTIRFGEFSVRYSYYFLKMYIGQDDLKLINIRDKGTKQILEEVQRVNNGLDELIDSAIHVPPNKFHEMDRRLNEEAIVSYMESLYRSGYTLKILTVPSFRKKKLGLLVYRRRIVANDMKVKEACPPFLKPARLNYNCFRVASFDPGIDFMHVDVKNIYSLNRGAFTSKRVDKIISALAMNLKNDVEEEREPSIDDVLIKYEEKKLYIFSAVDRKYSIRRGGVLNVVGSIPRIQDYIPHLLNKYEGRVLWIGKQPAHNSCSTFETLDFNTLKLDFISIYDKIKNTAALEYIINCLEQASGVSVVPGIVKTIFSEVCSRGHIENVPFTTRMYNLRNHLETHGTRDDLGQLVSVLFDRFPDMSYMNHGETHLEVLNKKRLRIDGQDIYETLLQIGLVIFTAKITGNPIDTVIINDSVISYTVARNARCNTYLSLLEQLIEWSTHTSYILFSHNPVPYPMAKITLGRAEGEQTRYIPVNQDAYKITVDNSENGEFELFKEEEEENKGVTKEEFSGKFESRFEEFYHRTIAFPTRSEYSLIDHREFFREHLKLTRILEVIMACRGRENIEELHYFVDPDYQSTIGWLRRNGYLVSEVIGISSEVERFFLKGKVYELIKKFKRKIREFCDQFGLSMEELSRHIYALPVREATGDDSNVYAIDTANFFLRCMVTARRIIAKGKDPNPELLALCALWEPRTRFKDSALANGYITARAIWTILELGERLAIDSGLGEEQDGGPELEIFVPRVEDIHPSDTEEQIDILEEEEWENSEWEDSRSIEVEGKVSEEILDKETEGANNKTVEADKMAWEGDKTFEGDGRNETSVENKADKEVSHQEDNILLRGENRDEEDAQVTSIHTEAKNTTADDGDSKSERTQVKEHISNPLKPVGEKENWDFYNSLPYISAHSTKELRDNKKLRDTLLQIPLFRFLEGAVRKKIFIRTPNLSLLDFQKVGKEEDLRKLYGLSKSQEKVIQRYIIADSGLNLLSLLQQVDNYGRYYLMLKKIPLPERFIPPKTVEKIPEREVERIRREIRGSTTPHGGILPLVSFVFEQWKKVLVDKSTKLKNKEKLQPTIQKIEMWRAKQFDSITIQDLALCNNILMSVQEMMGGMYLEDYQDDFRLRAVPEDRIREELRVTLEKFQLVSFNLAPLYPLLRRHGSANMEEKNRLEQQIKRKILQMVSRIAIKKY